MGYDKVITMKAVRKPSIDRSGRVVIPKAMREQAGLKPGTPVSMRFSDGRIEIEPEPAEVRVVARGKLRVATTASDLPALSDETVRRAREDLRTSRG